ncbi:replication initiation factor domain-containing protein [Listeria ilorinensis]|uniref:replication initiation factor domain-containing protein n=1 Tax=Listeria ilorinensis TaxID=2867439 RepID=UPI001EF6C218|nr:replication initiation factor domain-containing protein [Listeria ilorinensis]
MTVSKASAPATNRGAENARSVLEHLTSCIDWVQVTVMEYTLKDICEKLLRIPMAIMQKDEGKGIKGYSACLKFGDIRVLENSGNKPHYQVLMSGQGCRQYENFLEGRKATWFDFFKDVVKYASNVTRLDLAIDDRRTYFDIKTIIQKTKKGECVGRLRKGREHGGIELASGESLGSTIVFGSLESECYIVFYEKHYERVEKLGLTGEKAQEMLSTSWNRYELRFRQAKAVAIVHELIKQPDVGKVALGTLSYYMRFAVRNKNDATRSRWKTWRPWEVFMRDVGRIKLVVEPKIKDFTQLLSWLEKATAPSLWVVDQIGQIMGEDLVRELIDRAKINEKHHQMVEDYSKQYQTFREEGKFSVAK